MSIAAVVAKASSFTSKKAAQISVTAYQDIKYSKKAGSWEGKFNPNSISQKAKVEYFEDMPIGSSGGEPKFKKVLPSEISFTLLFDNFDSNSSNAYSALMGLSMGKKATPIIKQVNEFKKIAYSINGKIHQPNYLIIAFGDYTFNGKVKDFNADYKEFKSDGEASQAEVKVTFISAVSEDFKRKENNLNSPDMTHYYTVKEGDSLPVIAKDIYGDPRLYIELAKVNRINNFRNLEVGSKIVLPPMVK